MVKPNKVAVVDETYCVGCGSCIKVCPRNAITVPNGIYAKIMSEQCVGCGLCREACPASVITVVQRSEEVITDEK